MKRLHLRLLESIMIMTALFIFSLQSNIVSAASSGDLSYEITSALNPVVEDRANVFTDYEEVTIADRFARLRDSSGYQYIFMTVSDTKNYVKGREVETMYNQHNDDLYGIGTVLFLISTDAENPICEIQAYSKANTVLDHETCAYISDLLKEYAEKGQYTECIDNFFTYYNQAFDGTLAKNNVNDASGNTMIVLMLCLSVLVTTILFAVLYSKVFTSTTKANASDSFVIGKCTFRFRLIKNKITYIRSCMR